MGLHRKRIALALLAAAVTSPALACGFHEPSAMARGMMNWAYPDSLHVRTAVWKAQSAGTLAQDAVEEGPNQLAFARTVFELRRLSKLLDDARRGGPRPSIALVLLESMLWSRFETAGGSLALQLHVEGPAPGDVVIVTEAAVVSALVTGSVTARDAIRLGLAKLYAPPPDATATIGWLAAIEP